MSRVFEVRSVRLHCAVAALIMLCAYSTLAAPLDQWHWRYPLPQGNALQNVTFVNGSYIAVGQFGTVLTSPDGTNWITRNSGTIEALRDCAYGDGKYVIVGEFGTVLTSPDAVTWTSQYPGTFYSLNAVTYADGQFVAVGDETTILTSPDGITWTSRSSGPWDLFDVVHAEGVYVAVGGKLGTANTASSGVILSSSDGESWVKSSPFLADAVVSATYGNGLFAALSRGYYFSANDPPLWVSPDGLHWEGRDLGLTLIAPRQVIAFGQGRWLITAGYYGSSSSPGSGYIYRSADLLDWSLVSSNTASVAAIAFGDQFVAACLDGSFLVSPSAASWRNPQNNSLPFHFYDISYVNGSFVGVTGDQNLLVLSGDGVVWTNTIILTNGGGGSNFYSIAYGNGRYVAGGDSRTLWTSTDAVNWTNPAPELVDHYSYGPVFGITYGNGMFVAVSGYKGDVLSSANGVDWTLQVLGTNDFDNLYLNDVTFGNGRFVAIGSQAVVSSTDGTNWNVVRTNANVYAVAFGNGRFVAVGESRTLSSVDGTNWVLQTSREFGPLRDIAFGGGYFVAVGSYGYYSVESPILISADGLNWTRRHANTTRDFLHVAFGNGTFVIGGNAGAILQSDPLVTLSLQVHSPPQLTVCGPRNHSYRIDYTDDLLAEWRTLTTIFAPDSSISITDPDPPGTGSRFYRAVLLPEPRDVP